MENQSLKGLLLSAPEDQMDPAFKELVHTWGEKPNALQLLQLLDQLAFGAGASEFLMCALDGFLEVALKEEGLTLTELEANAYWRHTVQ